MFGKNVIKYQDMDKDSIIFIIVNKDKDSIMYYLLNSYTYKCMFFSV
jgi:hypothetical protein